MGQAFTFAFQFSNLMAHNPGAMGMVIKVWVK